MAVFKYWDTDLQQWVKIPVGKGDKGDKGDTGFGIPIGGDPGQIIGKLSATPYDVGWIDPDGSIPENTDLVYTDGQLSSVVKVSGTQTLVYDAQGRLSTVTDSATGIVKTLIYDVNGLLDEITIT